MVPDPFAVQKAVLRELDAGFKPVPGREVAVQFNPETLKVSSHVDALEHGKPGTGLGPSALQVLGVGTTTLSIQLWFDAKATGAGAVESVRELTSQVVDFMRPRPRSAGAANDADPPASLPGVRFAWGTFTFDGVMSSVTETLDYFSPEGNPLRAALDVTISGELFRGSNRASGGAASGSTPAVGPTSGTTPLHLTAANTTVAQLVGGAGSRREWQEIARLNGIENARLIPAGQLIDLNRRAVSGS